MTFNRQDWDEHLLSRKRGQTQTNQRELRRVALGMTGAKQLTGDPNWDVYLGVVQALIDGVAGDIESARILLADGLDTEHAVMLEQKMKLQFLRGRLLALEEVIGIPAVLLEQGEKAAELLKQAGLDLQ